MRSFLGENDMMAYLSMMAIRMIELHRVLKPTGSLYLHCDPTASHYLKLLLDAVFGATNFRNEIVWKRTSAHSDAVLRVASVHDILLAYGKSDRVTHNQQFRAYDADYVAEHFVHKDPDGRVFRRSDLVSPSVRPNLRYDYLASNGRLYKPHNNGWKVSLELMQQLDREGRLFFPAKEDARLRKKIYLDESPGVPVTDVWDDLPPIHASSAERLGYPTQKPVALLERVLASSSNQGNIVLDPFCGCGTTVHAAQKLGRQWIGIDVTPLAVNLIKRRLTEAFGAEAKFQVIGLPQDLDGAQALFDQDPHAFQLWAVSLIPDAQPWKGGKKGSDTGIDGQVYFRTDRTTSERGIISVKGGKNVGVAMIRDLGHVVDREKAAIGYFITLTKPTRDMETEAVKAGYFETDRGRFRKLQILSVEDLLNGTRPEMPFVDSSAFKRAKREEKKSSQGEMDL